MAFWDGYLYFAFNDRITAHKIPLFSSKNVPNASEIISERPEFTLKPSPTQVASFTSKMGLASNSQVRKEINHIRAGLLDGKPVIVAVGELGMIFAWDLMQLPRAGSEIPAHRIFYAPKLESTWGIAFNTQSSLLFVSSNAHTVNAFDYQSGECLFSDFEQTVHTHNIPCLDSKGNWLISAGIDQSCVLWDFKDPRNPKWHKRIVKVDSWGWFARFVDVESTVNGNIKIERSSFDVEEEFDEQNFDEIGPAAPYFLNNANENVDEEMNFTDGGDSFDNEDYDSSDMSFSDALLDAAREVREEFDARARTDATFVEGAERGWSTGSSDDASIEEFRQDYDNNYPELMEELFPDQNPDELSFDEIFNSFSNSSHYLTSETDTESLVESSKEEEEIDFIYNCKVCDEQVHAVKIHASKYLRSADCEIEDSSWPSHIYLASHFLTLFQASQATVIKPFHYLTQYCETAHYKSYWLSMLDRPSMGVWCDALQLLIFCEQSGALYVTQLGHSNAVALRVPEHESKYEIIGLSVRVVQDSEFGSKAQVFCLDFVGKLSLYEIIRIGP